MKPAASRAAAPAMLVLLAAALMGPVAMAPIPLNDSHWINLVWSDQFTAAMRAGDPWPRWLPLSHGGLGAPVFYFYGPVAFWLAGLCGLAGAGTWASLVLAAMAALAGSGLAMYAYLRTRGDRALAGAALYMIAPYHLLDFARRGALAEFTAFAFLPLVALGIDRAAHGRPAVLAIGYAALVMTHLPTALLASIFLVPVLAWDHGARAKRALGGIATGLLLGLGLAAAYLLPALMLQGATAMATMRGQALFLPANWTPATYLAGHSPALILLLAIGLATILFAAVGLLLGAGRWGWLTIAAAGLAIGLMPPVWSLPPLDRVQFPWRMLMLAEFGAAMVIARPALPGGRILVALVPLLVLSFALVGASLGSDAAGRDRSARAADALLRRHPDVIEYLPAGVGERAGSWSRRAIDLASRTPASRYAGGITTLRRFAFPGSEIRCDGVRVASEADPATGLIRYRGRDCALYRIATLPEELGTIISLAALATLFALTAMRRTTPVALPRHVPFRLRRPEMGMGR